MKFYYLSPNVLEMTNFIKRKVHVVVQLGGIDILIYYGMEKETNHLIYMRKCF